METGPLDGLEASDDGLSSLGGSLYSVNVGEHIPMSAPEGLYIVGHFDAARPTIIYVHGWVPDGNPPQAMNLQSWQNAGYNTLFMRWHVAATDSAAGCPGGGGIFGIPNMPCNAEARVFGARGSNPAADYAGERFVNAYKQLFGAYGSAGEIRLVGHSLGSQMVSYLAYRLYRENWGGPKPVRVDLLDPFAGTSDPGTPHPSYVVPDDHAVGGGNCGSGNRGTGYCRLENTLAWLRNRGEGIGILTIRSSVSHNFTNDLHYVTPVVELLGSWAGMNDSQKHGAVVNWYMCRISAHGGSSECAANPYFADATIVRGAPSTYSMNDALAHGSVFNWKYYAAANPDLAQAGITSPSSLLSHWRNNGARECRVAHPWFDVNQYRWRNADLSGWACHDATRHYVNHGLREGRVATASGRQYQPVLGPRTGRWELVHLGGTFTGGIPLIMKFETNSSTIGAHDDRMKY